jgi:hypothetical protein
MNILGAKIQHTINCYSSSYYNNNHSGMSGTLLPYSIRLTIHEQIYDKINIITDSINTALDIL